jgi:RNAse (barnase) inhibitor barstar
MPWLGHGFIYCVHADAEAVLRQQLEDLAFTAFTIEGDAVVDAQSLHAELARAFEFPEYYGANWDAFYDCIGDSELPQRSALLWRDAERLARSDLKAFAEAVAVFHHAAEIVGRDGGQLELFLLGTGSGFRRPSDPVDHAWRQLPL